MDRNRANSGRIANRFVETLCLVARIAKVELRENEVVVLCSHRVEF